jgi:hypothetical protein
LSEFRTLATVICKCGHVMNDIQDGIVTCLNPRCGEYGADHKVEIILTEMKPNEA